MSEFEAGFEGSDGTAVNKMVNGEWAMVNVKQEPVIRKLTTKIHYSPLPIHKKVDKRTQSTSVRRNEAAQSRAAC